MSIRVRYARGEKALAFFTLERHLCGFFFLFVCLSRLWVVVQILGTWIMSDCVFKLLCFFVGVCLYGCMYVYGQEVRVQWWMSLPMRCLPCYFLITYLFCLHICAASPCLEGGEVRRGYWAPRS